MFLSQNPEKSRFWHRKPAFGGKPGFANPSKTHKYPVETRKYPVNTRQQPSVKSRRRCSQRKTGFSLWKVGCFAKPSFSWDMEAQGIIIILYLPSFLV